MDGAQVAQLTTTTPFSPHGTPLMMVYSVLVPTLAVVGEEAAAPAHGAAVHRHAGLGEAHAGALAHAGHHARPHAQPGLRRGAQVLQLSGRMFNRLPLNIYYYYTKNITVIRYQYL